MSIPTPDKVVGDTGHTADHNAISEVLTDHADRIDALEGGGGLPDPTGNEGAVLGTDGTDPAWVRSITSSDSTAKVVAFDGEAKAYYESGAVYNAVVVDAMGSGVFATDGTESAVVCANVDGTVEITATGAVTVAPGDGFRVVGDVGAIVLNGDDYLMETASETDVQAPGATYNRSRGALGSEAAVENGDTLAVPLYAQAHDGTGLVLAATITAEVDGTVATGKVPTRVRIATADADGVLTDRMIIGADGTTDVLGDFTVNGSPVSGGGGGLVLIDSGTFSAASSVSLPTGVFDGTYDDYKLVWAASSYSAAGACQTLLQFRASGTDETGSVYSWGRVYGGGSAGGSKGDTDTKILLGETTVPLHRGVVEILGPNLTEKTSLTSTMAMDETGGGFFVQTTGAIVQNTTQYDSLTIYPSTGTITGRYAVYGYAK